MDYGWVNSKTEHMRTRRPPLCLPCSCSLEGARSDGQIFQGLRLQCQAFLDAAQPGEPGCIEGDRGGQRR